jgi:chromosome segregation ATPase
MALAQGTSASTNGTSAPGTPTKVATPPTSTRPRVEVAPPQPRIAGAGTRLADLDALLDGAFVAPRVIDQRAFDELASVLKGLVRDAAGQAATLEASTIEVKGLGSQLRDATVALESRLDSAQKALPAIEQRVSRAERVLEAARGELATRVAQIKDAALKDLVIDDATIRALIADRAKEMARAIAQETVKEELAALRQGVIDAIRQDAAASIAQAIERAAAVRGELEQNTTRATSLMEKLATSAGAAEATVERLHGLTDASDVRIAAISERLSHHVQEARDADAHLAGAITQATSTASNIARQTIEQIELASSKALDATSQAHASSTMANATIAKAQDVERTVERLCRESTERLTAAQREAADAVTRAEQTHRLLEYTTGQANETQTSLLVANEGALASIRDMTDGVATQAVKDLIDSAETRVRDASEAAIREAIDRANERAETLRTELASEFQLHERKHREAIAAATRDMADRIATMSTTIETLRAKAAEVDQAMQTVADLRDATNAATQTAAEMRELAANNALDGATLLERADTIAAAQQQANEVVARLSGVLSNTNERTEALAHSLDYMRQEYEHLLKASQEAARLTAPVAEELRHQQELVTRAVEEEIPQRVAQAVDGVVAPAVGKVQEMGDWLSALIAQAGQIGNALDKVALKHQPRLRAIETAIAAAQAAIQDVAEQVAKSGHRHADHEPATAQPDRGQPDRGQLAQGQAFLEHAYPELAKPAPNLTPTAEPLRAPMPAPHPTPTQSAQPIQRSPVGQVNPVAPIQYPPLGLDHRRRG